jgi:hypothetical protein
VTEAPVVVAQQRTAERLEATAAALRRLAAAVAAGRVRAAAAAAVLLGRADPGGGRDAPGVGRATP